MSADLSAQPTGGDLRHSVLTDLTKNYFSVWNTHDGAKVGELFSPDGSLRDWDIEVKGSKEVGDANGKIFTGECASCALCSHSDCSLDIKIRTLSHTLTVLSLSLPIHMPIFFPAVPKINIEVLGMVVDITTNTVAAEILVHIHDEAKTVLKVTDVIEYEPVSKKIKALRAYKG